MPAVFACVRVLVVFSHPSLCYLPTGGACVVGRLCTSIIPLIDIRCSATVLPNTTSRWGRLSFDDRQPMPYILSGLPQEASRALGRPASECVCSNFCVCAVVQKRADRAVCRALVWCLPERLQVISPRCKCEVSPNHYQLVVPHPPWS